MKRADILKAIDEPRLLVLSDLSKWKPLYEEVRVLGETEVGGRHSWSGPKRKAWSVTIRRSRFSARVGRTLSVRSAQLLDENYDALIERLRREDRADQELREARRLERDQAEERAHELNRRLLGGRAMVSDSPYSNRVLLSLDPGAVAQILEELDRDQG